MLQDDEIFGGLLEQIRSINHHHHSKQWSMITIRDSLDNSKCDDCTVFPPVNHENLHIPSHHSRAQQKQQHPSSKSSSSLSLAPPDFGLPSSSKEVIIGWLDFGIEILSAKICSIYSWFCNNGNNRGASWSFGPVAGTAMLVMWWWFCRRIRSRRVTVEQLKLKLIIKEKNEKINKLKHQIAEMNQVLVACHKVLASKLAI